MAENKGNTRRLEFYCERCQTPFTVWTRGFIDTARVKCPICGIEGARFDGFHEYK